jgi:hypothetical protein
VGLRQKKRNVQRENREKEKKKEKRKSKCGLSRYEQRIRIFLLDNNWMIDDERRMDDEMMSKRKTKNVYLSTCRLSLGLGLNFFNKVKHVFFLFLHYARNEYDNFS